MTCQANPFFICFRDLFYLLESRVTQREKGKRWEEIIHPLVHSKSGQNSQGWARTKPGV